MECKNVLVVVDVHTKWIETRVMNNILARNTVKVMCNMFSCYGIPDTVVLDKGTNFVSQEMFLTENGVGHVQTAPKKPSSNGLAEREV